MRIEKVLAREIIDSRGYPTVEVDVYLADGTIGRSAVPAGASTGSFEAHELRDNEERFKGKGVKKAINNIHKIIGPKLNNWEFDDLASLDQYLIEIDGSRNLANLGANAVLGVSLSVAKAVAISLGVPLYRYLGGMESVQLPVPMLNILNGGKHADNNVDIQEFMICPVVGGSFANALRVGAEIYHELKSVLKKKSLNTGVGDEGGFAPELASNEAALKLILEAIERAGYEPGKDVFLAVDVAASELKKGKNYCFEGKILSSANMIELYSQWVETYPLLSIEDGLDEEDWDGWHEMTNVLDSKCQLVGDDLFVTQTERIKIGKEKSCGNALLVKVNQVGTLTLAAQAIQESRSKGDQLVISHRSGETEDVTIADLAVAYRTQFIKTGAPARGERTAKYNQLLRIEEELGAKGVFIGRRAFDRWLKDLKE